MIITAKKIKSIFPKRTKLSSKIDGGHALIIGGAKKLTGSAIMSALAATRSGAGYTHLISDSSQFPWLEFPDFIIHPMRLQELKHKSDFAIGVGPGLGLGATKLKWIKYLIKNNFKKVVVDADALTLIAKFNISPLPESWILTPHEGELARLLKKTSAQIKKSRLASIKTAAKKFQCTIVLKGADTLISSPEKDVIISVKNKSVALAKAGTGDVLLGIIVALRAQGLSSDEAAMAGCFIHGQAAVLWEKKKKDYLSMRPLDLIDLLPETIFNIRNT